MTHNRESNVFNAALAVAAVIVICGAVVVGSYFSNSHLETQHTRVISKESSAHRGGYHLYVVVEDGRSMQTISVTPDEYSGAVVGQNFEWEKRTPNSPNYPQ